MFSYDFSGTFQNNVSAESGLWMVVSERRPKDDTHREKKSSKIQIYAKKYEYQSICIKAITS